MYLILAPSIIIINSLFYGSLGTPNTLSNNKLIFKMDQIPIFATLAYKKEPLTQKTEDLSAKVEILLVFPSSYHTTKFFLELNSDIIEETQEGELTDGSQEYHKISSLNINMGALTMVELEIPLSKLREVEKLLKINEGIKTNDSRMEYLLSFLFFNVEDPYNAFIPKDLASEDKRKAREKFIDELKIVDKCVIELQRKSYATYEPHKINKMTRQGLIGRQKSEILHLLLVRDRFSRNRRTSSRGKLIDCDWVFMLGLEINLAKNKQKDFVWTAGKETTRSKLSWFIISEEVQKTSCGFYDVPHGQIYYELTSEADIDNLSKIAHDSNNGRNA